MKYEELLSLLEGLLGDVDFEKETALIDRKLITSFDVVAIVSELNEEYGVELRAADILPENFNSAKSLYALIQKREEE